MLNSKTVDKIIFLDIETTSQYPTFKQMPENLQEIFKKRFKSLFDEVDINAPFDVVEKEYESIYDKKAPLYAEWGKIVCITIGWFQEKNITNDFKGDLTFKTKSFFGDDDKKILNDFYLSMKTIMDTSFNHTHHLCGHAAKLFDFPFIAKRFILNRMPLPNALDYGDKKPWDINYLIDTLDVWKYGQFDGGITLDMLATSFGIGSSKAEMDGSMVKNVYYVEKDLIKIERYCKADVCVLAEVYLRLKNMSNNVNIL